ncbi:SufD family Fe-S cluster assembly protein [candidate division WWE3 bacterium]|nr:SufD family Fe-S cluster assembly protein [candidate division WWE3 bacterium]
MENVFLKKINGKKCLRISKDTRLILVPNGEVSLDVELIKEGILVEVLVLYKLKNDESVFLQTTSIHSVPNTKCDVVVRAVLFDSSCSNYIGKIYIAKDAKGTSSYLEDNVLTIGEKTKNTSQPILEILADDVKASHGATTGRLDEASIYYLMTRGLTEKEAWDLLIEGFFDSILARIDEASLLAQVRKEIYDRK